MLKKNKDSLCSACFNNFHKFSSEIKKKNPAIGKEKGREKGGMRTQGEGEKQLH